LEIFRPDRSSHPGEVLAIGVAVSLMDVRAPARSAAAAGAARPTWGQILIVGGEPGSRNSEYVGESYDPISNKFALTGPLIEKGLAGATATVIMAGPNREKVLVAGGSADWGARKSTELYDPATNKFTRGPRLTEGRSEHTVSDVGKGRILIADAGSSEIYFPASINLCAGLK
jgi:hypothetical protein